MVSDAEKFSEEDKKQREAVDIRNSVRAACLACTALTVQATLLLT